MCVNFSPSIYGNSSLETNCGLALSWSSRMMGQKYCSQLSKHHHLQSVQGAMSCLSLLGDLSVLCAPVFGKSRHTQQQAGHCLHCLSSPAAFPPHQHCWVPAHFSWFCHHPWGSKFHFVFTSERVCASAEWADNRCRLLSAPVVVLQFCVTFQPLLEYLKLKPDAIWYFQL